MTIPSETVLKVYAAIFAISVSLCFFFAYEYFENRKKKAVLEIAKIMISKRFFPDFIEKDKDYPECCKLSEYEHNYAFDLIESFRASIAIDYISEKFPIDKDRCNRLVYKDDYSKYRIYLCMPVQLYHYLNEKNPGDELARKFKKVVNNRDKVDIENLKYDIVCLKIMHAITFYAHKVDFYGYPGRDTAKPKDLEKNIIKKNKKLEEMYNALQEV